MLLTALTFTSILAFSQESTSFDWSWFGLPEMIILAFVFLPFYFVPAIIAYSRKTKKKKNIMLLNVLLGWSIIGWIGAFIWSIIDSREIDELEILYK